MRIDELYRQKLGLVPCPTPLQEMKNLRAAIGCKPRLFIKRDDFTPIGLGGNKSRKLDYVMKEVVGGGYDSVVTFAGVQSNFCRQTAAFCAMLNLECHLVLTGHPQEKLDGNLLTFKLYGAKIRYYPDEDTAEEECMRVVEELKKQGKKPYYLYIGASTPLGSIAYIESVKEISEQFAAMGLKPDHLFLATGSAGTQAGTEIGQRLYLPDCKVHGVTVSRERDAQAAKVSKLINETAEFIESDIRVTPDELHIHDEYFGPAYAVPNQVGNDAIRLVARTEAILLDPVYTGKGFGGMLDMLKKGMLDDAEAVVYLHTGGAPALFHFESEFED